MKYQMKPNSLMEMSKQNKPENNSLFYTRENEANQTRNKT